MHKQTILLTMLALLALGVMPGTAATDNALAGLNGDLVVRLHFVGTAQIAADPVPESLKKIGALPATADLRNELLTKLADAPFRSLRQKIAAGNTNDYAPLLRPIFEDLLASESYAEMRGPTNAVPEFMLAVQLNNERAKIWQANLSIVAASWTGVPVAEIRGQGFTGWELRKHHDPDLIRCLRVGDWLLLGWGSGELRLQPGFIQRIKDKKRPVEAARENYLDALVDWPTLTAYHPITLPSPFPAKLPRMHLTVAVRKEYLHSQMIMQFPEPLGLKLEPWKIPQDLIHNPIVNFTVARGISNWLSQLPEMKELHPGYVPNQATIWSIEGLPFGTWMALPVPNSSNYLAQTGPGLALLATEVLKKHGMTSEAVLTNHQLTIAGGTPFTNPYLLAMHDAAGDFLVGGLFQVAPRLNEPPVPPELLHTIMAEPKLVYYNWEINESRIIQWQADAQVSLMSAGRIPPPPTSAGIKWLQAVGHSLGNCQTEITLTAPDELTLARSAPVGLTALEMTALEYWIDAPGFPLDATYPKVALRRPAPAALK
jgi:hypothetical protein